MFAVILSLLLSAQAGYDIIIKNGTVVDGSGAERFPADIAIRGDRIVRVDPDGIQADEVRVDPDGIEADEARVVLDAEGLIVAPGFIDQHAHVQLSIRNHPLAENFLRQGITN